MTQRDTLFAIKDTNTNKYVSRGGRGDHSIWLSMTEYLPDANMYRGKGPANTFINQYYNKLNSPNTINPKNIPPHYNLIIVEVLVSYLEK